MNSFDVITIGKATLDIFLWTEESNKHFRLNKDTSELCIKAGDKAIVDSSYLLTGGNANNVAVGISRMGFKAAIVAELGSDEFAQKIINTLRNEKVSEAYLKQTQDKPSSFSVILNFQGDRTIFEENVEREHDFSFDNVHSDWIYLTSMEKKWKEAYEKTIDFVKNNNIKLAFNPGTTQLDEDINQIEEVLKFSEIFFVNKEEGAKICKVEVSNGENFIRDLLLQIKNKGAKIVVITDGANGSFLIDDQNNISFHKAAESSVIERTGAGDGFASGFLSGVLSGKSYKDSMDWGSLNASSVISMIGAQQGLLTKQQIEEKLNHS